MLYFCILFFFFFFKQKTAYEMRISDWSSDVLLFRSNASTADFVGTSLPQANVALLAPIPRPRKNIFGIGLNYTEHVAESARSLDTSKDLPQQPVIFSKPPTAIAAWDDPIRHNAKVTQQLDWETELAVVIGRTARRVAEADALGHVFGYTVINDVSARDCRRAGQWIVSKGQDSFAPMGPCIVTADEIGDPQDLTLKTRVNGVEKKSEEHTSELQSLMRNSYAGFCFKKKIGNKQYTQIKPLERRKQLTIPLLANIPLTYYHKTKST